MNETKSPAPPGWMTAAICRWSVDVGEVNFRFWVFCSSRASQQKFGIKPADEANRCVMEMRGIIIGGLASPPYSNRARWGLWDTATPPAHTSNPKSTGANYPAAASRSRAAADSAAPHHALSLSTKRSSASPTVLWINIIMGCKVQWFKDRKRTFPGEFDPTCVAKSRWIDVDEISDWMLISGTITITPASLLQFLHRPCQPL